MRGPQIGYEKIDAPAYAAGQRRRVELPQKGVIHRLVGRLRYGVTVTGGSGAGAVFADAAHRIMDEVRLMVGTQPVQAVKIQTLALLMLFWEPEEFVHAVPANTAAGNNENLESWFSLPQFMPHSYLPHGFAFPASAFRVKPVLEVAYGNAADLFTPAADFSGAAVNAGAELELFMEPLDGPEIEALVRDPEALARAFPPLVLNYYEAEVSQSETGRKIRLNDIEPGDEIRALIVETFAGGANGARYAYHSGVIEELRLELDGRDAYGVVPFAAIQQRNKREYGLEALQTGVAFIDAAENKLTGPGELWRLPKSAKHTPTLHVKTAKQSGDNMIRVTTIVAKR